MEKIRIFLRSKLPEVVVAHGTFNDAHRHHEQTMENHGAKQLLFSTYKKIKREAESLGVRVVGMRVEAALKVINGMCGHKGSQEGQVAGSS